ncbi:hypothetical protein MmTuc01_3150 [Methanosarcina mazei Tuc01]|uniref:Uncharacterized protein n=1 Tax=Methanosarcina mazei Tuc01 TaxID=1236903 RepID=M1PCZ8_METMZ|nr:hypothetical protein MmTuc01_3150 [Methanosarcina mazei Tuc01]
MTPDSVCAGPGDVALSDWGDMFLLLEFEKCGGLIFPVESIPALA